MDHAEAARRLETVRTLYPPLFRTLDASGIRVVWVFHPMSPEFDETTRASVRWLNREACRTMSGVGVRCVDLTDALAADEFSSLTHLNEAGHRSMAELLGEILVDELP